MTNNNKPRCIEDIRNSARSSAVWRRRLHAKYFDPRNGIAADKLDRLAVEMHQMTDDEWDGLKVHYNSPKWFEAVSETARRVGFRYVDTVPEFVKNLIEVLSRSQNVAA